MNIRNLTPHALNVYVGILPEECVGGKFTGKFVYQPNCHCKVIYSDGVARCSVANASAEPLCDIPVVKKTFGEVSGIPEDLVAGDVIIVSAIVGTSLAAQGFTAKTGIRVLGAGSAVVDGEGKIVGCLGLSEF